MDRIGTERTLDESLDGMDFSLFAKAMEWITLGTAIILHFLSCAAFGSLRLRAVRAPVDTEVAFFLYEKLDKSIVVEDHEHYILHRIGQVQEITNGSHNHVA